MRSEPNSSIATYLKYDVIGQILSQRSGGDSIEIRRDAIVANDIMRNGLRSNQIHHNASLANHVLRYWSRYNHDCITMYL